MCLIVFALNRHENYPLILVANRDEFLDRPTATAGFWEDAPHVLGGRDLREGGTWLGVTIDGRFAAVTNYREPGAQVVEPFSRGKLVADYLKQRPEPAAYARQLEELAGRCNGFNILYGTIRDVRYASNRGPGGPVSDGIHALSNHLLDTPWPKAERARQLMEDLLSRETIDPEQLIEAISDSSPFPDHTLPHSGVSLELERFLSPLFIRGGHYGTRSTTVLLASRDNRISFTERTHYPSGSRHFTL